MLNVSDRPSPPHPNPHPNLQADSQADYQSDVQLRSGHPVSQGSGAAFGVWLNSVIQPFLTHTPQIRQRGNVVHVLCEGLPCPAQQTITDALRRSIAATPFIDRHLTPEAAPVHRIVLYGRTTGDLKPAWGEIVELPAAETSLQPRNADGPQIDGPQISASQPASHYSKTHPSKAKRKNLSNEGIAHHLSRQLSPFNIAVRVRRKQSPIPADNAPAVQQ